MEWETLVTLISKYLPTDLHFRVIVLSDYLNRYKTPLHIMKIVHDKMPMVNYKRKPETAPRPANS